MKEPAFGAAPAEGAVCPQHPPRRSVGACARCGRFLCAECRAQDAPPTCADCLARSRDALGLGTQGLTAGGTLRLAFALLRATAPVVAVVVGLGGALSAAIDLGSEQLPSAVARAVDRTYGFTIGLALQTAVLAAMLTVSQGRTLSPGAALGEGLGAYGRVLKARVLSGLMIGLFALLLIVPGVLKALSLAFVTILAWRKDPDPLAASTRLTAGRRWALLGVLTVAFLVFFVALAVPLVGMEVTAENFPALRVPASVLGTLGANLAERFLDASVVAAFLLLENERRLAPPAPAGAELGPHLV